MARRRVEIKKIEDRSKRQVTFTKRRQGLFKKAKELRTVCHAQVAIIAFSMAGNLYAFGDPSVKTVVDRYRNAAGAAVLPEPPAELVGEFEAERKIEEILEKVVEAKEGRSIWDSQLENLGLAQIDELKNAMEDMKKKIVFQQKIILANPQ